MRKWRSCSALGGQCDGDVGRISTGRRRRTTRGLPLHLQRSTATHIITHTDCAVRLHSQEHPHTPRSRGVGTPRVIRHRGSVGAPVPGNGGLRTPHPPRNATAHCAAQTILHLPQWSRAKSQQVPGVRGSCSSTRMWTIPSRRTQQIRRCGVAERVDTEAVFSGTSARLAGMMVRSVYRPFRSRLFLQASRSRAVSNLESLNFLTCLLRNLALLTLSMPESTDVGECLHFSNSEMATGRDSRAEALSHMCACS